MLFLTKLLPSLCAGAGPSSGGELRKEDIGLSGLLDFP